MKKSSEITPEQIAEWKKKHGEIFLIEVDGRKAYLRKPDRKVLGYAATVGKTDPFQYNEVILKNCWLGGDEEIKTDDDLFLSASTVLGEIIEFKEATLKKL